MERRPAAWLVLLGGYFAVACLGFIDYLTGDYSLLIFYVLPVFVVAWHLGQVGVLHIALAAGLARTFSDYYTYAPSSFRYCNSLLDMMFLLMLGLLLVFMKNVLRHDRD